MQKYASFHDLHGAPTWKLWEFQVTLQSVMYDTFMMTKLCWNCILEYIWSLDTLSGMKQAVILFLHGSKWQS